MIEKIKNYIIHLLGGKSLQEFDCVLNMMNGYKHVLNMQIGNSCNGILYGYIATDKNNKNYLYLDEKPVKGYKSWLAIHDRFISLHDIELPSSIVSSWNDVEPISVIIKIQKYE